MIIVPTGTSTSGDFQADWAVELANFWLFFWATFSGTGDCGPRNVV